MRDFENLSVSRFRVDITKKEGWFVATSEEIQDFYLAHYDRKWLFDHVPLAIKELILEYSGADVQIVRLGKVLPGSLKTASVPVDTSTALMDSLWEMGIIADRVEIGYDASEQAGGTDIPKRHTDLHKTQRVFAD
ncbi:MAG: hypothetical protein OXD36_17585 [Rhodobacter sp.]|nr:hypothetical protein [Rhodobacter sp.]